LLHLEVEMVQRDQIAVALDQAQCEVMYAYCCRS
jgi:hypothetical protein